MFILSWNVAGLSTTLQRIQRDYNSQSVSYRNKQQHKKREKLPQNHAFSYFLSRHGSPDIVCIQEHKISLSQLSSRSEMLGASTLEGYESFWSCCVDPQQKGFHGVCTYAKVGTVIAADAAPLGSSELDAQGRVCMTDHGCFVVFNVYAPSGGAMPLSYKMKFLNALRRVMRYQKEERGKKVILVGDLNIVHQREDTHWEYRSVHVDRILKEVREYQEAMNDSADGKKQHAYVPNNVVATEGVVKGDHFCSHKSIPKWKLDLGKNWMKIAYALQTMEAVPVTTKNVATGTTFEKFRVRVRIDNKFTAFIGRVESTKEDALAYFCFPQRTYFDHDSKEERVSRDANVVSIDILGELMSKIAKVEWSSKELRSISEMDDSCYKSSPPAHWLNEVLEEDKMVDAFRSSYPHAQGRFTCWNQHTNKRFENKGFRIDYTLLDRSMLDYIDTGPNKSLRCCKYPSHKFDDEEAALHAATASGSFEGASYEGGGIATASQAALDTQFDCPHTGIIYTPPSYSDHVAVSLLLKSGWTQLHMPSKLVLDGKDLGTKKAQPHKSQKSISSFFANTSSSSDNATLSGKGIRMPIAAKKKGKERGCDSENESSISQPAAQESNTHGSSLKRKFRLSRDVQKKTGKVKQSSKSKNNILHHFSSKN